jgi:hypothetical protein
MEALDNPGTFIFTARSGIGVDGFPVDTPFKMKVGTGRKSRTAHQSNGFTAGDRVSNLDHDRAVSKVCVEAVLPFAVVDYNVVPVTVSTLTVSTRAPVKVSVLNLYDMTFCCGINRSSPVHFVEASDAKIRSRMV